MAHSGKGYVDADGHVRDLERHYQQYIEEPYNRRPLAVAGALDTFDRQIFGTLGGPQDLDAKGWLDILDKGGMETTVLYPTSGLAAPFIQEPDFAVAFCRAYNNFVSEEYVKVSPRLKAVALLPLQDPGEAANELRRAVEELNLVGGMLPADGPYLLGKPQFYPIYQQAQDLDTMLAVHASGSLKGRGSDEWLFDRLVQAHTLSHSYGQMRQMTSILFEGVPEMYPSLRLAFLEAGCTWVPYWMDRMDEEYEIRGKSEAPVLKKKPGDYVRDGNIYVACEPEERLLPEALRIIGNIYVACEPEERLLPETLRIIGSHKVVFASDYPHWDGTFPESLYELQGREDLSEADKTAILADNPRALYGLP